VLSGACSGKTAILKGELMKQYERFVIYGLLLILLILVGWFINNKTNVERYQCWSCSDGIEAYILDTKTDHLYWVYGIRIRDCGAIKDVPKKRPPLSFEDIPNEPQKYETKNNE
jgi:hypothetical protein